MHCIMLFVKQKKTTFNSHAGFLTGSVLSKETGLNFGLNLHLHPLFVYVSIEGPGESVSSEGFGESVSSEGLRESVSSEGPRESVSSEGPRESVRI